MRANTEARGRGRSQRQRKRGKANENGREELFMEEKVNRRAFQAGGGLNRTVKKPGGWGTRRGSVEGGRRWGLKALRIQNSGF